MRHVQLAIPTDLQREICRILEEDDIEYAVTEDVSEDDSVLVSFPLPVNAVEDVLGRLRETGLQENQFAVILDAEAATTADMGTLEKQYADSQTRVKNISPLELRKAARRLEPDLLTYATLITLGTIVAVVGLLINSALLLAAAIVIAPFGDVPIASGVGAVIDDREMFVTSVRNQVIGVTLALLIATASAFMFHVLFFIPPQIDILLLDYVDEFSRLSPFTLAVAVMAGVVGSVALATDRPTIISGLAISVALIPTAATVGVGISWGEFSVAFSAFVLLTTMLVLINVTGFLTLVGFGYTPSLVKSLRPDIGLTMERGVYVLAIIVLVLLVSTAGIFVYQNIRFELAVKHSVNDVLSSEPYEEVRLVGLNIDYTGATFDSEVPVVTVTVASPKDVEYGDLVRNLQTAISQNVDRSVVVRVHVEEFQVLPEEERARALDPESLPHRSSMNLPRSRV